MDSTTTRDNYLETAATQQAPLAIHRFGTKQKEALSNTLFMRKKLSLRSFREENGDWFVMQVIGIRGFQGFLSGRLRRETDKCLA